MVSRGSYQFWGDLETGLREIHRVLAPAGQAFVGRGFPPTAPEEEVQELRRRGVVGGPKYDPAKDAARFRKIMERMGVEEYEVLLPKQEDASVRYGVWVRFGKE